MATKDNIPQIIEQYLNSDKFKNILKEYTQNWYISNNL